MRKLTILAAAALAGGCAADERPEARAEAEAELAAELANYEQAGEPVSCVPHTQLKGNRTVGNAIVFDGPGRRIWVNEVGRSCPSLDFGRALVTQTSGSQLCRGDIARVIDPVAKTTWGGCALADFVPYDRRERTDG